MKHVTTLEVTHTQTDDVEYCDEVDVYRRDDGGLVAYQSGEQHESIDLGDGSTPDLDTLKDWLVAAYEDGGYTHVTVGPAAT